MILPLALALAVAGGAAGVAALNGRWLALACCLLIVGCLAALTVHAGRPSLPATPSTSSREDHDGVMHRLLLDASPTPLLLIDGDVVRALNRAARRLFDTDDRVLPPPALFDRTVSHVRHAGRTWRADRVEVGARTVVALIDVDGEERAAEARASADMIQILGHELLNGLVPIVALAESGLTEAAAEARDPGLLSEILTTLARRAEGLQRFTEAYRSLARLPPPLRQTTSPAELIEDLARLFLGRWPDARLTVEVTESVSGAFDRDQLSQAIWALLQNAAEADMPPPSIRLAAIAEARGLTIDIADDGPGVPAAQARRIFRPFTTTKPAGTGIGLSLARQIAQAHGGTLELLDGRPTTFRLRIPFTSFAATEPDQTDTSVAGDAQKGAAVPCNEGRSH